MFPSSGVVVVVVFIIAGQGPGAVLVPVPGEVGPAVTSSSSSHLGHCGHHGARGGGQEVPHEVQGWIRKVGDKSKIKIKN